MSDDEQIRAKRRDETDLQWRTRIAQLDADLRTEGDPLVTKEAERHGDYRDDFVMHVETQTLARTKRNRLANPMLDLFERGTITAEQYDAAVEIMLVAETITVPVGMRSASLEARVDNFGSARNLLVEQVDRVRIEATYSKWRQQLPMPRAMVIDMIVAGRTIFATARKFRMGYPKARMRLIDALDNWTRIRAALLREIDERDVAAAQFRAGGGTVK